MISHFIFFATLLISQTLFAASWDVRIDEREGMPTVSRGGAVVVAASFAFWGSDWRWADQQTTFKVEAPFTYGISSINKTLKFSLIGKATKPTSRQLEWKFDMNSVSQTGTVIGGGIIFKLDRETFGFELGEPELLPANRGWAWGGGGRPRLEMRFDPPLASVHFERGNKSEIRAYLFQGAVPQGRREITATLTLSPEMNITPTLAEKFGIEDPSTWPINAVDWLTLPVDLSFLNARDKPAGRRGFLRANKDRLEFEDGSPVRFWGTNLTAAALFGTSKENVRQQARRLSALGFNLVRFHHHDSLWVAPNIFGDKDVSSTQNLVPGMLEQIDWWIKCLKEEGIYVWLDLHVGRNLKAGDNIEGFVEISGGRTAADLRGYNFVNPEIVQAMKNFNEAYVMHRNSHTGLRYRDDPAIVAMLISNENDVTQHFAGRLLPDKKVPRHSGLYMAQADAFAKRHGLPKDNVWHSWEFGVPKLFLNDLEYRFGLEMAGHLRSLGVRVPLVTTSTWGENPVSSLPALTAGDVIDAHSYGAIGELEKDPAYSPTMATWISAAQVLGKPLSVTEWNVQPFPVPDRHVVPLYMAASASQQGWDAMMQYAYAQVPLNSQSGASNWHAFNDPAMFATLPAAALAYRRGDLRESSAVYVYAPGTTRFFSERVSPKNSIALRTAAERGKLVLAMPNTKELPWLKSAEVPVKAIVFGDPRQSMLAKDSDEAISDTGETRRNWKRGTYTINTPRTQAAMGWIGGQTISLADVEISVATRNATVAVQSLTSDPLGVARSVLISFAARSVPAASNQLPFRSEPVAGNIAIRGPRGLKVRCPDKSTNEACPVSAKYKDGWYRIPLGNIHGMHWIALE